MSWNQALPLPGSRKVDPAVLKILSTGEIEGQSFRMAEQLDRALYGAVDRVLVAAEGRWNRSARAHIFERDAAEAIDAILTTGFVVDPKQALGAFYTPAPLAERLVAEAGVRPGDRVLEPSVGHGAIVQAIVSARGWPWGYEIDPDACAIARALFPEGGLYWRDFLGADPAPVFARVVMNPPFARQADVRHVRHAFAFLRPGGRLVSVMSAGVLVREDRVSTDFRSFVYGLGGRIEALPENSFEDSGTRVRTAVVTIDKPRERGGASS